MVDFGSCSGRLAAKPLTGLAMRATLPRRLSSHPVDRSRSPSLGLHRPCDQTSLAISLMTICSQTQAVSHALRLRANPKPALTRAPHNRLSPSKRPRPPGGEDEATRTFTDCRYCRSPRSRQLKPPAMNDSAIQQNRHAPNKCSLRVIATRASQSWAGRLRFVREQHILIAPKTRLSYYDRKDGMASDVVSALRV